MSNRKVWFIAEASPGFGLPLISYLLEKGYRVAAAARDMTTRDLHAQNFLPFPIDLMSEPAVRGAIQETIRQFQRIDFVVNNAGYDPIAGGATAGDGPEMTAQGLAETATMLDPGTTMQGLAAIGQRFEDNVFGGFHVLKEVLPYLQRQRSGHVIHFPSPAANVVTAQSTIHLATKLAIESLSNTLTADMEDYGIRVTTINSDFCPADLVSHIEKETDNRDSIIRADHQVDDHPCHRYVEPYWPGDPRQSAMLIEFLLESPLQSE